MRLNADGTMSVVLGLVHADCVTQTHRDYQKLFLTRPEHDPVNLVPEDVCWNCRRKFSPNDRVALQGVLA